MKLKNPRFNVNVLKYFPLLTFLQREKLNEIFLIEIVMNKKPFFSVKPCHVNTSPFFSPPFLQIANTIFAIALLHQCILIESCWFHCYCIWLEFAFCIWKELIVFLSEFSLALTSKNMASKRELFPPPFLFQPISCCLCHLNVQSDLWQVTITKG